MKLLIAGGGTGGHVFPALAIASEWLGRGAEREVLIVGTKRGMEMKLVPQAGLPLETIRVAGLKGIGGAKFIRNFAMLAPSMMDSTRILTRHRFAAALGVGGYASGPMMLMAALGGIPTVIFEPNAEPGFTNKVLARMATRIATAYESTAQRWGKKAIVTGCPVRAAFFNAPQRTPVAPYNVLITGGSQGALAINRAVIDSLDQLLVRKEQLRITHQTGERDYNAVRTAYARREFNAEVVPFLENMPERFAQADIIVCRSGAITAAEIAASGRAAIFIPFAGATDSHQLRNAEAFVASGAARLIPPHELTPARLTNEIFSLLDQPQQITELSRRANALARPNAVREITDLIEQAAKK